MANGQKPFNCHSKSCTDRTLLSCLRERIKIGNSPREDGTTVARGEDVADREKKDGKRDEDEVPDNQRGQKLTSYRFQFQVRIDQNVEAYTVTLGGNKVWRCILS